MFNLRGEFVASTIPRLVKHLLFHGGPKVLGATSASSGAGTAWHSVAAEENMEILDTTKMVLNAIFYIAPCSQANSRMNSCAND